MSARSPILDYATSHPVPPYVPPEEEVPAPSILLTEALSFILNEAGSAILIDE